MNVKDKLESTEHVEEDYDVSCGLGADYLGAGGGGGAG